MNLNFSRQVYKEDYEDLSFGDIPENKKEGLLRGTYFWKEQDY